MQEWLTEQEGIAIINIYTPNNTVRKYMKQKVTEVNKGRNRQFNNDT